MKLHIEFCERWNYRPQFEQLAQSLENKFPDIDVLGTQNTEFRIGSFEITYGDEIIFSKLAENRFPESEEIINLLKDL